MFNRKCSSGGIREDLLKENVHGEVLWRKCSKGSEHGELWSGGSVEKGVLMGKCSGARVQETVSRLKCSGGSVLEEVFKKECS